MKKLTTLITLLFLCAASLFAQAPEKFTYQAVVRNASNSLVANSPVGVRVSILQGGVNGTLVYMETQTAVTNANGLITLQIGGGNVQQGNFTEIDWAGGSYFLKTETDPEGGSNYTITSTQQLLSVPYALYAKDAGNGFSGDYNDLVNLPQIPQIPSDVSAFNNDAGYITGYTETDPQYNAWDKDYNDLINKPTIPTVPMNVSAFTNDAGYITSAAIPTIPTVPTNVSAFNNDAGYLTTYTETDPQFNAWDKDYNDLINKPSIPTVPTNVSAFTNDAGYITSAQVPVQVNADWNATAGAAQILNKPALFSGNYNDLTNKPTLFSGNYNDLTNKPTLFDGNYNSLTNRPNLAAVAISGSYNDLINKPAIPAVISELTNNVGYITAAQVPAQVNADWNATSGAAQILNKPTLFSGNYNDLTNLPQIPQIPADISAFNNDAGYLTGYTETDPQFNAWDKDYNDLTNKPTIPTVPTNVTSFNNDAGYITANDIPAYQVLSISNDTIYLSNGGYAVLPPGFDGDYNSLTNRPDLFSGSYNDLTDTPAIPTVPTNVSAFTNDAGYLTGYTEQQVLSISNDTIFLTGGSFVKLPAAIDSVAADMAALLARVEQLELPSVSTLSVNNVSYYTALVTGRLFNSGIYWISGCGFCWSTSQNPTLDDNHITVTNELGSFSQYLTGLDAGTTYYVRAYATNSAGTAYGEELSFTTTPIVLPTVTTLTVSNIFDVSATCGCNVISNGGATVTACGVCWSTSQSPTISDSHTTDGSGTGSFTSSIEGLTSNTTYYIRAYATNNQGTAYGEQRSFTTAYSNPNDGQPCPGTPTVTDHEGNVYNTVQIGDQCWTKENLRTTTSPSTGTYLIPAVGTGSTSAGKQARWYDNDSTTFAPQNYGLLYNWNAAVDTFNEAYEETTTVQGSGPNVTFSDPRRGICPVGWHLPSDSEWIQLSNYVGSQSQYVCGGDGNKIAKALASTAGWNTSSNTCAVGNDLSANNATDFSALPVGNCSSGHYYSVGDYAYFWSATKSSYSIRYEYASPNNTSYMSSASGFSVRCLLGEGSGGEWGTATLPMVTTDTVSGVTSTTATGGGNVTSNGGSIVTARGVCWSTSPNPTISDSHTTNGRGRGVFTSSINGLIPSTTYYVRAYVTNSVGTAYGEQQSFTTVDNNPNDGQPCPATPTVADHEGNVYNTVQIGSQCWLKENLRTTTSPSTGTYLISTAVGYNTATFTGKQARWYGNDSATYAPQNYGLLYNWNAAMDTFNTAYGEMHVSSISSNAVSVSFSGHRRGICPAGWHLPSDDEWTTMTSYVSSQEEYVCVAKALASTTGWESSYGSDCYVGYRPSNNNATGFSVLPAGNYNSSDYSSVGNEAYFWSATQNDTTSALFRCLDNSSSFFRSYWGNAKNYGFSVRCLRDTSVFLPPAVTTNAVGDITPTSATCGGNVSADDGVSITTRGVCWSTSPNPTVGDNHTDSGTGAGAFSATITGLTPSTTYYVRAYATHSVGTIYGDEVSFTTSCSLISTLPFTEDFESYASGSSSNHVLPDCWDYFNSGTSAVGCPTVNTSTTYAASNGNGRALYFYSTSATGYADQIAILPEIDTSVFPIHTLRLSFDARRYNETATYVNYVEVGVIEGISTFVPVDTVTFTSTTISTHYADFSNYNGQGTRIAIRAPKPTGSFTSNYTYLDNIKIALIPRCPDLTDLHIVSLSASSVELAWTDGASESSWEVLVAPANQAPDYTQAQPVSGNPTYTVSALNANTQYKAYVRTVCSNNLGYNDWQVLTFSTLSNNPAQLPYFHDFDDAVENAEWVILNSTRSNKWYIGMPTGATGSMLYVSNDNGATNNYTTSSESTTIWAYRDVQFGPGAEFQIKFNWRCYGESSFDFLKVYLGSPTAVEAKTTYSTANATTYDPAGAIALEPKFNLSSDWVTYTGVVPSSFANSVQRLYFRWSNDGGGGTTPPAAVDSIFITPMNCGRPFNVTASGITTTSANITFTPALSTDGAWEYVYTDSSTADPNTLIPAPLATTAFTLGGLNDSSTYYVYVRTDCGGGEYSDWSQVATFNTECGDISLPYSESFDSYPNTGSSYHPDCWTLNSTYNANYPYIYGTYYASPNRSLYFYGSTAGTYSLIATQRIASSYAMNGLKVSFKMRVGTATSGMIVGVMDDPTNVSSFVPVDTVYNSATGAFLSQTVSLASYTGTGHYVAFKTYTPSSTGAIYIDDVLIEETSTSSAPTVFTCGTSKMVDADGNEYETVQVGTQCWTKTNLRSTKAADGSAIPAGGSTTNYTAPYYYDYSSLPLATRGYLYNWPAANEVCPSGWHLPSDAEWTTLTDYVSSQSEFQCGGNSNYIAKALASTEGWNSYSGECYPGDQSVTANNATGFSAVPAGGFNGVSFLNAGSGAYFWSSTRDASGDAYNRNLRYGNADVFRNANYNYYGRSVRCLRD